MYDFDVCFKKTNEYAKEPYRASAESAGYDLYAAIDSPVIIKPNETVKITTGLQIALPSGTFGAIFPRSGLATKKNLVLANTVGIADADYRGNYIVALRNSGTESQVVSPGDRIAQLIILPFFSVNFVEKEELDETERGEGGFGHSGT